MAAAAPLQLQVLICIVLLCSMTALVVADERRPARNTKSNDAGTQSWGYVEVRNKAHMFWFYQKSPHRVSTAEKPWRTLLYAAPASSKHIRPDGLNKDQYPRTVNDQSMWLHHADIIFVDSPVGTGFSYYDDDASPDVKKSSFSQTGADVVELLKDLAVQIPTLRSSPLILLTKTYDGHQVNHVAGNVLSAILERRLNLKVGGSVLWFNGKATIMPFPLDPPAEDYSTSDPSAEDNSSYKDPLNLENHLQCRTSYVDVL